MTIPVSTPAQSTAIPAPAPTTSQGGGGYMDYANQYMSQSLATDPAIDPASGATPKPTGKGSGGKASGKGGKGSGGKGGGAAGSGGSSGSSGSGGQPSVGGSPAPSAPSVPSTPPPSTSPTSAGASANNPSQSSDSTVSATNESDTQKIWRNEANQEEWTRIGVDNTDPQNPTYAWALTNPGDGTGRYSPGTVLTNNLESDPTGSSTVVFGGHRTWVNSANQEEWTLQSVDRTAPDNPTFTWEMTDPGDGTGRYSPGTVLANDRATDPTGSSTVESGGHRTWVNPANQEEWTLQSADRTDPDNPTFTWEMTDPGDGTGRYSPGTVLTNGRATDPTGSSTVTMSADTSAS